MDYNSLNQPQSFARLPPTARHEGPRDSKYQLSLFDGDTVREISGLTVMFGQGAEILWVVPGTGFSLLRLMNLENLPGGADSITDLIRRVGYDAEVVVAGVYQYDHHPETTADVLFEDPDLASKMRDAVENEARNQSWMIEARELRIYSMSEESERLALVSAQEVTLQWRAPTVDFCVAALNDNGETVLDKLAAQADENPINILGKDIEAELDVDRHGRRCLALHDVTIEAQVKDIRAALLAEYKDDVSKDVCILKSQRRTWPCLVEQLETLDAILGSIGKLWSPLEFNEAASTSYVWSACATFVDSRHAAIAVEKLGNMDMPFNVDADLDIRQIYRTTIRIPVATRNQLQWSEAELEDYGRELECTIHEFCDPDCTMVGVESFDRRSILLVKHKIEELVDAVTRQKRKAETSIPGDDDAGQEDRAEDFECVTCCVSYCELDVIHGGCGHAYCKDCFTNLVKAGSWATKNNMLICEGGPGEPCGAVFDLEPIAYQISQDLFDDILKIAFKDYIGRRAHEFRPCPDPDCNQFYPVTPKDSGPSSRCCPGCVLINCTTCPKAHDERFPCSQDAGEDVDPEFEAAKRELEAKSCPRCGVAIQKSEGCNNMECGMCHAFMCWACPQPTEAFETKNDCYAHLLQEHGRVGDGPEYMAVHPDGAPVADEAMLAEHEEVEAQLAGHLARVQEVIEMDWEAFAMADDFQQRARVLAEAFNIMPVGQGHWEVRDLGWVEERQVRDVRFHWVANVVGQPNAPPIDQPRPEDHGEIMGVLLEDQNNLVELQGPDPAQLEEEGREFGGDENDEDDENAQGPDPAQLEEEGREFGGDEKDEDDENAQGTDPARLEEERRGFGGGEDDEDDENAQGTDPAQLEEQRRGFGGDEDDEDNENDDDDKDDEDDGEAGQLAVFARAYYRAFGPRL